MKLSLRDFRARLALKVVGLGFAVWSLGLLLGNLMATHSISDHEAIVANHGLHGMAYLIFASAIFVVREGFRQVCGPVSMACAQAGLILQGALNIEGAYEFAVDSRGPSHLSSEIINYGIPVALLLLSVSCIGASRAGRRRSTRT